MATYLVIDAGNVILNVIVWDEGSKWAPPAGCSTVKYDGQAEAGWVWDDVQKQAFDPKPKVPDDLQPPSGDPDKTTIID